MVCPLEMHMKKLLNHVDLVKNRFLFQNYPNQIPIQNNTPVTKCILMVPALAGSSSLSL